MTQNTRTRKEVIDDVLAAVRGRSVNDAVDVCLIVACGLMVQVCARGDLPIMRNTLFKRLRDLTDGMAADMEKMK